MKSRVKELRKALNLTQQDFAKSIGISRSNVAGIESGAVNLTDRNIAQICSKHKANEEWIRTGTGEMFLEMDKDEEFAYLIGTLAAEPCDYKKDFIKAMLELENEDDWKLVAQLVERLKK